MGIRKWVMKQQWRVVQIRGIWSLFYGILLLAYAYFAYIPVFADQGILGPFAFAGTILVFFLIAGYLYDKVFQMWAPALEVTMERNPYQYVPAPFDQIFWFPVFSSILDSIERLAENLDVNTDSIKETREYYSKLQVLNPERSEDIDKATKLREDFRKNHNFSEALKDP